ncbi:glycosyltransferase family 2 protein [Brucepastera parasyntrophica]|uniref:glycosyltransferase family 2 protein n=1 Tax=Brucepastera parasyntrophica TaxID=2880008 RepID=UPI00210CC61B|nr:glycosyltransferase family 2 protein [Brucepastera parasyntrophica]ULQ60045.1 glycosyltransferase family 2 protein [Brucepastera parasyntrophica]
MAKISIIIPVYNVEKYLRECLDSCITQTLRDIEIVCVNDASPDNSSAILDEYAKKDNRIKVITHEKNLGLGGARNTGISAASGEYVWFVDSDDFISPHSCEILYSYAKQKNADIVRFNAISFSEENDNSRVYDDSKKYFCNWPYDRLITIDREKTGLPQTDVSACIYITKKGILRSFSFREKVYHEDTDFTPILFSSVEKIYCITFAFYFRRRNQTSITGGGTKKTGNWFPAILKHVIQCLNLLSQKNCPESIFV